VADADLGVRFTFMRNGPSLWPGFGIPE
jgi:hypothetical protein